MTAVDGTTLLVLAHKKTRLHTTTGQSCMARRLVFSLSTRMNRYLSDGMDISRPHPARRTIPRICGLLPHHYYQATALGENFVQMAPAEGRR